MRALVITLLLLIAIPVTAWPQVVEQNYGGTSHYNGPNLSGTRQSIGGMDYFNFSDGSSTTRQSFGNLDYYSGNRPGLSGSVQSFGNLGYGSWNDGTQSTHQSFGGIDYLSIQRGGQSRNCTSQRIGNQTYTNCY